MSVCLWGLRVDYKSVLVCVKCMQVGIVLSLEGGGGGREFLLRFLLFIREKRTPNSI